VIEAVKRRGNHTSFHQRFQQPLELKNPKSEGRNPKEVRIPKPEQNKHGSDRFQVSDFGLRASFELRISVLGFVADMNWGSFLLLPRSFRR
jgi:hypothetical protein